MTTARIIPTFCATGVSLTDMIASFTSATLAPVGSLARVEQAETWVLAAMFAVDDAAVAVALSCLQGWATFGPGWSEQAWGELCRLIAECEGYLAAAKDCMVGY